MTRRLPLFLAIATLAMMSGSARAQKTTPPTQSADRTSREQVARQMTDAASEQFGHPITFRADDALGTTLVETDAAIKPESGAAMFENSGAGTYIAKQGFTTFFSTNGRFWWAGKPCSKGWCGSTGAFKDRDSARQMLLLLTPPPKLVFRENGSSALFGFSSTGIGTDGRIHSEYRFSCDNRSFTCVKPTVVGTYTLVDGVPTIQLILKFDIADSRYKSYASKPSQQKGVFMPGVGQIGGGASGNPSGGVWKSLFLSGKQHRFEVGAVEVWGLATPHCEGFGSPRHPQMECFGGTFNGETRMVVSMNGQPMQLSSLDLEVREQDKAPQTPSDFFGGGLPKRWLFVVRLKRDQAQGLYADTLQSFKQWFPGLKSIDEMTVEVDLRGNWEAAQ